MNIAQPTVTDPVAFLPALLQNTSTNYRQVYEDHRCRVYALAFWMSDSELVAEELMTAAFCRAFAVSQIPSAEQIDGALVAELREYMRLGELELDCEPCYEVRSVRYNILRVDLERAVVQLPATEKMIFLMHDVESYDHERIARTLGITTETSRHGLHQARLRLRALLGR